MDATERQLWEIVGTNYRLPVYAQFGGELKPEWGKDCVRVALPIMPLLRAQRDVVEQLFKSICERADASGWILREEKFLQFCLKSSHDDPQNVVVWNWSDPAMDVGPDFIGAYCRHNQALIRNRNEATLIWSSFCKFALQRIARGVPVDLGFVKLISLPLRRNWIAILLTRHWATSQRVEFSEERFKESFQRDGALTAWDNRHGVIRWDITAIPTDHFHDKMRGIEVERRRTAKNYAADIRFLVKAHTHRIHEIFKTYLEEAGRKVIRFPKRRPTPVEVEPPTDRAEVNFRGSPVVFGVLEKSSKEVVVGKDEAWMPDLSDLQPPNPNVRDSGRDVDQSTDQQGGTIGVPVRDVVQGEDKIQLLAVRPDEGAGERPGVVEGTEQLSV